jgi:hypothetical protein
MTVEWWTDPAEAAQRVDALSEYWDQLSNAALGRGVQPLVSEALATEVASLAAAYRKWRAGIGGYTNILNWRGPLEQWGARANATRAKLAAAGVKNLPAEVELVRALSIATLVGSAGFASMLIGVGVMYVLTRSRA